MFFKLYNRIYFYNDPYPNQLNRALTLDNIYYANYEKNKKGDKCDVQLLSHFFIMDKHLKLGDNENMFF